MPLGYRVITDFRRPPAELVRKLGEHFSADLADAMQKAGAMARVIQPAYPSMQRFAGPAVTASLPTGSFSMAKLAMLQCQAGDVLVLNVYGDTQHALIGGHIARAIQVRGVAGLVVDGAVRDVSQLRELGFPVFARGTAVIIGGHDGPGEINVPVACGGVVVNPGDIVVADEDGVVVVPQDEAENVLARVESLHATLLASDPDYERGVIPGIDEVEARMRRAGCEFI